MFHSDEYMRGKFFKAYNQQLLEEIAMAERRAATPEVPGDTSSKSERLGSVPIMALDFSDVLETRSLTGRVS